MEVINDNMIVSVENLKFIQIKFKWKYLNSNCIFRWINMNRYNKYLKLFVQVFVANPNKPRPILEILLRNKEKLVEFLSKFHTDRSEDEQFNDEKAYLIKQIKELKPLEDH